MSYRQYPYLLPPIYIIFLLYMCTFIILVINVNHDIQLYTQPWHIYHHVINVISSCTHNPGTFIITSSMWYPVVHTTLAHLSSRHQCDIQLYTQPWHIYHHVINVISSCTHNPGTFIITSSMWYPVVHTTLAHLSLRHQCDIQLYTQPWHIYHHVINVISSCTHNPGTFIITSSMWYPVVHTTLAHLSSRHQCDIQLYTQPWHIYHYVINVISSCTHNPGTFIITSSMWYPVVHTTLAHLSSRHQCIWLKVHILIR